MSRRSPIQRRPARRSVPSFIPFGRHPATSVHSQPSTFAAPVLVGPVPLRVQRVRLGPVVLGVHEGRALVGVHEGPGLAAAVLEPHRDTLVTVLAHEHHLLQVDACNNQLLGDTLDKVLMPHLPREAHDVDDVRTTFWRSGQSGRTQGSTRAPLSPFRRPRSQVDRRCKRSQTQRARRRTRPDLPQGSLQFLDRDVVLVEQVPQLPHGLQMLLDPIEPLDHLLVVFGYRGNALQHNVDLRVRHAA
mmetsp:Transcript_3521/g.9591  ORF Transcript_3521/g.9591 Transcript_3521/m.9591 type:complete len:245 (+) Transcript_3521:479-1213(+)